MNKWPAIKRKGSSTVVVILVSVLLASIAVLSVSYSNSGLKLSNRLADRTKEYYALDSLADKAFSLFLKGDTPGIEDMGAEIRQNADKETTTIIVKKGARRMMIKVKHSSPKAEILIWREMQKTFETEELKFETIPNKNTPNKNIQNKTIPNKNTSNKKGE